MQNLDRIVQMYLRICLSLLLLLPAGLHAQEFRAVLTGQVNDSSGATIADAAITAVNTDSGTTYTAQTSNKGVYYIPYVLPGTYTVTAKANGFKTSVQDKVRLLAAQSFGQNFTLQVGSVAQEVVVNSAPPALETANGSGGTLIDSRELANVPLNGRQAYMLIGTTPGSQFTQTSFGPGVGNSGTRGWDVTNAYTIGGSTGGFNQFTLNGSNITQQTSFGNQSAGAWNVSPNLDAVDEVNVMTTTYDARYGRTAGGTVNVVTKSGGDNFHGTLFEAYEGAFMNANTFHNKLSNTPRQGMVQNQFDGTVGGPVIRNKLFFFFGFEGYRESLAGTLLTNVPPAYLRPGYNGSNGVNFGLVQQLDAGEFPNGLPIFQPGTAYCLDGGPATACNSDHVAQQAFANNTIPASQINGTGAALLKYIPLPNIPGAENEITGSNYLGKTPDLYSYNQPMIRVDYNLTDKTKLYSFFEWQRGTEFRSNNGLTGIAANGNINWIRENWAATQDMTHVFSPTLLGDFKVSFARFWTATPDGDLSQQTDPGSVGLNMPLPPTTSARYLPEIRLGDGWGSGIVEPHTNSGPLNPNPIFGNTPGVDVTNNISFDADLTKTAGAHNMHVGGTIAEFQYGNPGSIGHANGNFAFGSGFTQFNPHNQNCYMIAPGSTCNSNAPNGSAIASLLLGFPSTVGNNGPGNIDWNNTIFEGQPVWAIYFQDDWRVTHRLTLNLGIRYDVQRGLRERNNELNRGLCLTCVNPLTNDATYQTNIANTANQMAWAAAGINSASMQQVLGGVEFAGTNGQPRDAYNTDWSNVGPRIGFAFAIDPKTVVRGGWGLQYAGGLEGGSSIGFTQSTPYINSIDGGNTPTSYFQQGSPFPNGLIKPQGTSAGLLTGIGQSGLQFDFPGRKLPREQVLSFGIQRELPGALVLDARFAGNFSSRLRTFLWVNGTATIQATKAAIANPTIWDQQVPNPYYNVAASVEGGCGTSSTVQAITLLLPLSQFCSPGGSALVGEYNAPMGRNWYDGLEVKLTRRATRGLTTNVAYTYSKTMNRGGYQNGWPYQDAEQQRVIANTDRTHVFSWTSVWDLPIGRNGWLLANAPKPVGLLVNNWTLSSVAAIQSGTPVGINTGYFYTCAHSYRPDGGTSVGRGRWFNTDKSCWQGIPAWGLGDLRPQTDQVRNPTVPNFDFSLQKSTPIRDNINLLLRLDAFNAFNSVLFGGPNTDPGAGPARFTPHSGWNGFGTVGAQQQNFPRILQISGKIIF